jgi:hypothetical protein
MRKLSPSLFVPRLPRSLLFRISRRTPRVPGLPILPGVLLALAVLSSRASAQEGASVGVAPAAQAVAPAAGPLPEAGTATPAAASPPPAPKKGPSGPALGLSPEAPGQGGADITAAEATPAVEEAPTGEWKFDVTGYFRAPLRMSWGPPTTAAPGGGNAGTQYRTPPLVPDANYIDWRYTNSFVAPWTELNFHYGNDRVRSTVQIASYNLTDSGYRQLQANLGINEAFLTLSYPEFINENGRLTLLAGGFQNRYGAAGRYDAGKYQTYLFGQTHIVGETLTLDYDVGDWTFEVEQGFGGKLTPIPFYGAPTGTGTTNPNTDLPDWEPYPGPLPQESTFVHHEHIGAVFKKELILGLHYIDVFANDDERAGSYTATAWGGGTVGARLATDPHPSIVIAGGDAKLIGGVLGEGYLGYSHLSATNAMYIADAIEVLHSYGGWQLHDNYFGPAGSAAQAVTGTIDSVEFQYAFSLGQYFHYPQAFWGDGPDLIATVFGMYNHVYSPAGPSGMPINPLSHANGDGSGHINKLKFGAELNYVPLPWLGVGGRFDSVQPDLDDSTQSFSVFSPRLIFRTAFVTHEQVMLQYSRYFYGNAFSPGNSLGGSQFPYNAQAGASGLGVDKNAAQIAAIIWF